MLAARNQEIEASQIRLIFNKIVGRSDVINLTAGIPDFDTPPHVIEAAKRAMDEGFTRYTHNAGYIETREAVAQKLKRDNNIDADPVTEIMMTAGGMGGLLLANLVLVDPGDEVLIPDPGFVSHGPHAVMAGGVPVPVPLHKENNFGLRAEDIEPLITDKTKLMILNSPNNPTGGVTEEKELRKIADLAIEHDFYIVADEAYEQFNFLTDRPFFIGSIEEAHDRVVSIFSFSKTYAMTGWRIGAATGPEEIISAMTKLQEHVIAMPTSIAQKAAEAAVIGPQDCVREMRESFRERRDLIVKGLSAIDGIELQPPGGAFYVFPDISAFGLKSYDLVMKLLEETRVALVHGSAFGANGEGYVRICYAVSRDRIEKAIAALETFLPKLLR
ncbi:MAG: pyridoxal phosphate-dependent aminotransferase [Candidatus Thorarchaeota archaeon]